MTTRLQSIAGILHFVFIAANQSIQLFDCIYTNNGFICENGFDRSIGENYSKAVKYCRDGTIAHKEVRLTETL